MKLTSDIFTISIHGTTGQDIDEGTLEAGALVRNVREEADEDGDSYWTFDASTDGGMSWFHQRSYEAPQ